MPTPPKLTVHTDAKAWDTIWKWRWFTKPQWQGQFRKQREGTRRALASLLPKLGGRSVLDCSCMSKLESIFKMSKSLHFFSFIILWTSLFTVLTPNKPGICIISSLKFGRKMFSTQNMSCQQSTFFTAALVFLGRLADRGKPLCPAGVNQSLIDARLDMKHSDI